MRKEFFIVGDYYVCGKIESCLVRVCANEQQAQELLPEIIANPPERCLGNIYIESANSEDCWWNQGGLD